MFYVIIIVEFLGKSIFYDIDRESMVGGNTL